jgi:hypothetical protein
MRISSCLILFVFFAFPVALTAAPPPAFRPPAVPLVAHDPYFSIWSFGDRLTDGPTKHWTGRNHSLTSLARIDGKTFRIMGAEPADVPALPQTGVRVLPTRTIYSFANEDVALTLTFLTPALPDDLDVLARPLTYIEWTVKSTSDRMHKVQVYFDAAAELVVEKPQQTVAWNRIAAPGLQGVRIGSESQLVLGRPGDDLRIDWGHAYLAVEKDVSAQVAIADRATTILAFKKDGSFPATDAPAKPGTAASAAPGLIAKLDFRDVGPKSVSRYAMLAYDDEFSIRYFEDKLRPYWRRNGMDAAGLIVTAAKEHAALSERCAKFDDALIADLTRIGGEGYAQLAALAYRQTLAGSKLAADRNGQPLFFPKENHSNGCIATVDVIYPMAPFCLLFSPALTKAMLIPILDYAASPRWKFEYAPHDLGQYPFATGQVYGGGERTDEQQMMVEESANMLLLVAALAKAEGNVDFVEKYWPVLTKWAAYLEAKGFDPENQLCTDDFAGHLAHNTNLSAKAICALGAFAQIAEKRGDLAAAQKYRKIAREFAIRWEKEANDGDHFRLAFDKPGTWSQKYNLVWDRILGLKLFSAEGVRKEMNFYKSHQLRYGLPLDSRDKYAKLDWTLWTACLTDRREDFDSLVAPVVAWVSATPNRTPLTDWYLTDTAKRKGFDARPVVGGLFIPMLGDAVLWQKWVRAGSNSKEPWAPLPLRQRVAVLPTGEEQPQLWRVKYDLPSTEDNWMHPKLVLDASWQEQPGPFGLRSERGISNNTKWTTPQIWLRRDFELKEVNFKEPRLRMVYTGDCEVYLNGVLAIRREGRAHGYEHFELSPEALQTLHAGGNVIAVHAKANPFGNPKPMRVHLDIGIIDLKP